MTRTRIYQQRKRHGEFQSLMSEARWAGIARREAEAVERARRGEWAGA